MSLPFVGATIVLISKSEIRYVGILIEINKEESTVTLQDVRSFGTEGRRNPSTGLPEIPASDKVFDYIVFRGRDIKDLQVNEVPQPKKEEPIYEDPAIVQRSSTSKAAATFVPKSSASPAAQKPARSQTAWQQRQQEPRQEQRQEPRQRQERQQPRQRQQRQEQLEEKREVPKTEFDFTAKTLDKKQIQQEMAQDEVTAALASMGISYDKKASFFDSISNEVSERMAPEERRNYRNQERTTNMETFGVASIPQNYHRGRGRGRGGYRGRGRGGGNRGARRGVGTTQPTVGK